MTSKVARNAVPTILLASAFVMTCDGLAVYFERPIALLNIHRYGLQCMALVDPTIPELNQLNGVDPGTASELMRASPKDVAFMRSHPSVSITVLDDPTYRNCFQRSNSSNAAGTDAIFINSASLPSPELRARAIVHELVHVEHNHKDTPQGQHSWFGHLWVSEEGESHEAEQKAAEVLSSHSLNKPLETAVLQIYPLPIAFSLWMLGFFAIFLESLHEKRQFPRPQAKTANPKPQLIAERRA